MKASPTSLRKIRTYTQSPDEDIFSGHTISSAFSEHFCFERSEEISVFYAVYPPLMFLLKTLHCTYVNCNRFHKRERLFLIVVQQLPRRWNISLNLSEYVPQLSTPWGYLISRFSGFETFRGYKILRKWSKITKFAKLRPAKFNTFKVSDYLRIFATYG